MNKMFQKSGSIFLALMLTLTSLLSVQAAPAFIPIVVTNTNDSGGGSLRQALLDANDGDIIDLTGVSGTITLASELSVMDSLTINGPGSGVLTISGNNAVRVLSINSGKTVQINNLTIANGRVVDNEGAGIKNFGSLTLENVTVINNHVVKSASDFLKGGGIYSHDSSSLTLKDTIISGNSAVQNGGGIHVSFNANVSLTSVVIDNNSLSYYGSSGGGISIRQGTTATLDQVSITNNFAVNDGGGLYADTSITITNSLVADNTVGSDADDYSSDGGGLHMGGAGETFSLRNVTISGNSALNMDDNAYAGGISMTNGTLNLNNVTIANNTAEGQTGGLYVGGSTVNIGNSIIGGNTSVNTTSEDCTGTVNSLGYNLIQDPTSCTIDGSIIGVLISLNPMLKPLADNGGPTQTHALPLNSPAVDAGDNTTCELTDQRGFNRPQGTTCDMGAYELRKGRIVYRSTAAQDGWVLESGENTNIGGIFDASSPYLFLGDDPARKQYRSLLSFKTSSLPDTAVLTKVILRVKRESVVGGGNPVTTFQGFMLDLRKGTFGTSTLQLNDFQAAGQKTLGPLNTPLSAGWYVFNLTSTKAYINKLATAGGLTQIRLRFKLDDNNNALANYLKLYSGNAPVASRPQLIVEYYVP